MNINQQLYETAYEMLLSMLPQGLTEDDLDKYLQGNRFNPKDLKEVYKAFIRTAQNYQFMPNVIQFDNRENTIAEILHNFDYKYVCTLNPDDLFDEFKSAFGISSEKSWRLWNKAVVDSAKFICPFKSIDEFNEFVTKSNDLKTVPLLISKKIRGIGFALACNALKDIGYINYVKPDVHLIDICDALGIARRNQIEVFDAMQQIAKDNNITPYKLDKVLWLVCSGYFYEEQIRVKGRKEELINKISGVQEKNQHILRVRKHRSDSNSDLQTRIEKIQVKELESELNKTDLGNDAYLYFKGDPSSKIKPDIYSDKYHIIGEVYSHLGKLKSSQMDKVTADILKMTLFVEDSGSDFTIYYVLCDEAAKESLLGNAIIKNACRLHGIQIKCYPLEETLRKELKETMERQNITI